MSRPAPDFFLAKLMLDYLIASAGVADVPDEETLPKVVMGDADLGRLPGFILSGKELSGSQIKRSIHIMGGLLFRRRATGPDAAQDAASLARSQEFIEASRQLNALESRMIDRAALGEFILTLDDAMRDGFRILKIHRLHQPDLSFKKDAAEAALFCAVQIDIVWYPETA